MQCDVIVDILAKSILRLIDFYRLRLSPHLPSVCRFQPSCSKYAQQAVIYHGPVKGVVLTIVRICRCNPLFRGGFDPIPLKREQRQ